MTRGAKLPLSILLLLPHFPAHVLSHFTACYCAQARTTPHLQAQIIQLLLCVHVVIGQAAALNPNE